MQVNESLIQEIDKLLPQTQCEKCDYPGCLPYASAIINEGAPINQCDPGGQITVDAIARVLDKEDQIPLVRTKAKPKSVAIIKEDLCVGCTICMKYCPTDAIVGANKLMHTVIENECTGCELCVSPCPADCIEMVEIEQDIPTWSINNTIMQEKANLARKRFNTRKQRIEAEQLEKKQRDKKASQLKLKSEVLASIKRAKEQKELRLKELKNKKSDDN